MRRTVQSPSANWLLKLQHRQKRADVISRLQGFPWEGTYDKQLSQLRCLSSAAHAFLFLAEAALAPGRMEEAPHEATQSLSLWPTSKYAVSLTTVCLSLLFGQLPTASICFQPVAPKRPSPAEGEELWRGEQRLSGHRTSFPLVS